MKTQRTSVKATPLFFIATVLAYIGIFWVFFLIWEEFNLIAALGFNVTVGLFVRYRVKPWLASKYEPFKVASNEQL